MAAKKSCGIEELKKQIKDGNLDKLYLFYGEEDYLKEYYIEKIKEAVPHNGFPEFNHLIFNGKLPFSEYDDAWESFPMMSDRKLIIIKDCEIVKAGKGEVSTEEKKAFWSEKLNRLSDDTVVVFNEVSADKRSVLYKEISKKGTVIEFSYLSDTDLISWVIRESLNKKKKISKENATYLVSRVDMGLSNLMNELNKLFDFCNEEILRSDIDRVVSKSLNVITFDLTEAIMKGDTKRAVSVLNDIKNNTNDSSFAILYLMLSTFEKILHAKLLSGKSNQEIASEISVAPFFVKKYIDCAKAFETETLVKIVNRVSEIDFDIKEGRINEWTALYEYVTECLYYQRRG